MLLWDASLKEPTTSKVKRGLRHEMTPDALGHGDLPGELPQRARRALNVSGLSFANE
jgi:hypothetical protein